jgi:ubiquinone/menaquinone biosynthesis C-methylase UbiE
MFPRQFDLQHPEQMDRPTADPLLLAQQLRSLRRLNRWFGGYAAYATAWRALRGTTSGTASLLDLCTGNCDHPGSLPLADRPAHIFALDWQPETLRQISPRPFPLLCGDARQLPFPDHSIDYVICSLALHHFTNDDARAVLAEMKRVTRRGAAVIDLVRSRRAYAALWLLTTLWMRDPYTVHDGRASILAAFSKAELRELAHRAGWTGAEPQALPWFRQMIVYKRH